MDHTDHVALLQDGMIGRGGVWADFGSGRGAFTLALAELIGPTGEIHSVDKDIHALRQQERAMRSYFPDVQVHYHAADYTERLDLPPLDGAVMANALHFQRRKDQVVQLIRGYVRAGGRLLIVEYNIDRGNRWVPYPLTFTQWEALARRNGFTHSRLLRTRPSRYFGEIFSAESW